MNGAVTTKPNDSAPSGSQTVCCLNPAGSGIKRPARAWWVDCSPRPARTVAMPPYFLPRIESLAAFATRNFRTFLAGILMVSPVAGLRPVRAFR